MILSKSAVQEGAFNLAGLLANVNPQNLIKPDIHRRAVATNYDILEAFSGLRIGLRILINPKFFSHFVTSTREKVFSDNTTPVENYSAVLSFRSITRPSGKFSDYVKKGIAYRSDHQQGNQCYSPNVAAKSATGRRNPSKQKAIPDAESVFFCIVATAHLSNAGKIRTLSMVALVGRRSRLPDSFCSGIPTPANVTAISERRNSGGDSLKQKEAAAMLATTPTHNPQFIWLIAAVRRDMPTITAKIHHIAAETEREARRILARDHVCFFAGRIRTGGAHA
ncbi:host cell division inhibitor Icd-like protein [Klebsiella quasipneumoniae]|uniref:host cell division inhibitor Icd-like protein n=1 Tax=Klebsiella quasipneumoniae TaxID=1463165 RepID=UPI0023669B3E|nr:host cell division inhibitor Icd-like protein [Klebsiella quasipneumoniae]MDD7843162.1 host cell division inhibitor Icd-like protein [Klebsiella quasipneumoniae]MDD7859002.1 host cell division inhibitor Icd-like protein [Klebsiella quasipneumoniae]MDF8307175.1 host cell division inhibitor Icd-like protein [Klebsiella quasipneumoniae]